MISDADTGLILQSSSHVILDADAYNSDLWQWPDHVFLDTELLVVTVIRDTLQNIVLGTEIVLRCIIVSDTEIVLSPWR